MNMSLDSVQAIIGKASTEAEFRKLLQENPEKAFEGYELTDEEKESLSKIDNSQMESFAESLDNRISKGFSNIG